jgi:hypothetical protein
MQILECMRYLFYRIHVNTSRIFLALSSHVKPLHGYFKVHGATKVQHGGAECQKLTTYFVFVFVCLSSPSMTHQVQIVVQFSSFHVLTLNRIIMNPRISQVSTNGFAV